MMPYMHLKPNQIKDMDREKEGNNAVTESGRRHMNAAACPAGRLMRLVGQERSNIYCT